jgi:alpha-D-ribose 1-methylphosphonate 5-triphosphate synthase subunit PhnG
MPNSGNRLPKDFETNERRQWMKVLALASPRALEEAWEKMDPKPAYRVLRGPEIGLVMLRAKAGGTGAQFNLGEMTLTRCAVQVREGAMGFAYIAGRVPRKAELAAVFDALLQQAERKEELVRDLIGPLTEGREKSRAEERDRLAATRVEFFTMVRGDG